MQAPMDRLAELLSDFRDAYGDDPDCQDDTFTALMEIVEAAEDLVADDAPQHTKSVDSTSAVGLTLFARWITTA